MINSSTQALEIKELSMTYPASPDWVLDGFNLSIASGERLALTGSSGCGKSSVARVLLQLLPSGSICKGTVLLGGKTLNHFITSDLQKLRGEQVGLIFQDPMSRLNPLMTVGRHLLDTLDAHEKDTSPFWKRQRAEELLERVGIDSNRFNCYPHEFSGGMRQRLAIALAIALNPPLLIADEPTTSLDVSVANQVMSELSSLCDEFGTALLLITHDLALAARWCERMAILSNGHIIEESKSTDILLRPRSEIAKRLVSAAREREGGGDLITSITQNSVVLQVERLRCWHSMAGWPWQTNWLKAVNEVSFSVSAGETIGIVGASGCGKSTLCRALMGLVPIKGGSVKLNGKNLLNSESPLMRQSLYEMQMVFQDPLACFNPKMTIGEAVGDPFLIHKVLNKAQAKEKVRHLLIKVGLCPPEQFQQRLPKELSGGQLQRAAIARAIALNPKVLICDESVSMLDADKQAEILNLLRTLKRNLGLAILFVTHDLAVANGFCDKLIVLDQGRIVEQGPGSQILSQPKTDLTKKLVNDSPRLPLQNEGSDSFS